MLDSPDLLTMEEVAQLLRLRSDQLARWHVKRSGIQVIRIGRLQVIRREDLPKLAGALASFHMEVSNIRDGLSADGRLWGSRRASTALGISVRTLKRETDRGSIPGVRHGRIWYWEPEEIARRAAEGRQW